MTLGRKLISLFLLLTVIITPLTLTSCDRSYNKDEVISEAKRLLTDAHMLYSVYYGNGIMHHGGGHSEGDYEEADVIHLHQLGFETIDELKELTYKTFSEKYTESIIDNYLTSFEEDGIVYNFARYVQLYDGEDLDIPSVILVYSKHKPIFEERIVILVDPMLATGGSAVDALTMLKARGCKQIRFMCLVAAPEGVRQVQSKHPDVDIYAAALDECLNEHAYIVPGLGDAGDRIFGTL